MVLAAPSSGERRMTPTRQLDVSALPQFNISSRAPLFFGQLLLCAIEGSMFCMLMAIYFYLRLSVDVWPPPGTQIPHLTASTLALAPLIMSVLGSWWASEGAKKDDRRAMLVGLIANLLLACGFLALRFREIATLNFNWATDAHGTIVWSILFLHTLDVIADLLMTVILIWALALNRYGPKQRLGVHVDSIVWYFLAAIWIPLYVVIYWGPHIVGAP
jgi:cytochrome c oxidase subunit I+III